MPGIDLTFSFLSENPSINIWVPKICLPKMNIKTLPSRPRYLNNTVPSRPRYLIKTLPSRPRYLISFPLYCSFPVNTEVLKCIIMTKYLVLTQSKPPFIPQDPQTLPLKHFYIHNKYFKNSVNLMTKGTKI